MTLPSLVDLSPEGQQQSPEEDSVHQRASLVLEMANNLITSNHRRKRQLQQIECGRTDSIAKLIDEIMLEKPVNVLDLLMESEPKALPSSAELRQRYKAIALGEDEEEEEKGEEKEEEEEDDDNSEAGLFEMQEDDSGGLPPETIQAHLAPLQDQLKRAYAAIVKLRENADIRYAALEKEYLDLKREKQDNLDAFQGESLATDASGSDANLGEQLKQAYEALIRLRENSSLRYNVLESKYLDLKREHADANARNERLEKELEDIRLELFRDPNSSGDAMSLPSPSRRATIGGSNVCGSVTSFRTDCRRRSSIASKQQQLEKKMADKQQRLFLQEFHVLCDKVEDCDECREHIPQATLVKVKEQLAKIMDDSSHDADSEREEKEEEDTLSSSHRSSPNRHTGAMALLGAKWEKIDEIDESKLEERKESPGGRFANLREPKSEKKLRGKKSQFVAAQSGVYCRIDHDMQNQYGDLDRFEAPSTPPPPPPPHSVARVRKSPPTKAEAEAALRGKSAIKNAVASPTDVREFVHVPTTETLGTPSLHSPLEPEGKVGKIGTAQDEGSFATAKEQEAPVQKSSCDKPEPTRGRRNTVQLPLPEGNSRPRASTPPRPRFNKAKKKEFTPLGGFEGGLTPIDVLRGEPEPAPAVSGPETKALEVQEDAEKAEPEKENEDESNAEVGSDGAEKQLKPSDSVARFHKEEESLMGRVKKIPPAKLDAAERKAKREAALREAKAAAKNIRKQNMWGRKNKSDMQDSSVVSGISNVSSMYGNDKMLKTSLQPKPKPSQHFLNTEPNPKSNFKVSLFKNPFKRGNKNDAQVPAEIVDEPVANPSANKSKTSGTKPPPMNELVLGDC